MRNKRAYSFLNSGVFVCVCVRERIFPVWCVYSTTQHILIPRLAAAQTKT